MCEIDINNTLSHISELSSSHEGNTPPTPKIKIKVGQVREKQSYPLNATLKTGDDGYVKTRHEYMDADGKTDSVLSNIKSFNDIFNARDNNIGYAGNYLNDDTLNKRYAHKKFEDRQADYISNLISSVGITKGETLGVKRMPGINIDNNDRMNYIPGTSSQSAAKSSLFAAAMNEAVSIATHIGVSDDIVGTKSLATNPQNEQVSAMRSIGEMMNAAVERIYNGPEMKSMAAQGVSDEKRAKIANNSFDAFIRQLEESTATSEDYNMRTFLKNYRVIQNEEQR